jgi:23S rRNA pseudouridine955/2504/2580 synthase
VKQFIISPNDAGQRLDKFLQKAAPQLPAALLYKALRTKHIKRNKKRCEGSDRLATGDVIDCWLDDALFEAAAPAWQHDFLRAGRQLEVLFADAHVLLLDKPAGLLAHPDENEYVDTLLGRVQRYLYEKGEYDPAREQAFAPALVNRIDRNTQGIVIAAKTAEALRVLNEKMKRRELCKFYLCAVHGVLPRDEKWHTLTHYLQKDSKRAQVRVFEAPRQGAKECRLKYRALHNEGGNTLLEVELLTGRTHQIRAQMAAVGHALVGDGKYAPRVQYQNDGPKHQCLCAWRLRFCFEGQETPISSLNGVEVFVKNVAFLRDCFPDFRLNKEIF